MMRGLAVVLIVGMASSSANGQSDTRSLRELSQDYFDMFRTICFDTGWPSQNEKFDLELLGFEAMGGESKRRQYRLDTLYLASFLAEDSSAGDHDVCTLSTRSANAGVVREIIKSWDFAGVPLADEVRNGSRLTFWDVSYRRHQGAVLLEEKNDLNGAVSTLSLVRE